MERFDLPLTRREAHVVLRALAASTEHPQATWLAERLLRLLDPERAVQPIDQLIHSADSLSDR